MLKLKGLVLAAIVSAAVAALWPVAGSAATLKGVVVAREHGRMLVASRAGHVSAVRGAAAVGSRVAVGGGHATVVGRATSTHLRGIVLRHVGRTLFISSDRHLLALQSSDTTPAPPGTIISAQVGIANGQLDEQDEDDVGRAGTIMVQATVTAVAAGSVTLTVEGQSLTVSLPGGLTLPASLVGQTVTIQLSVAGANDDQGDDDHGDGDHGGDHGGGGDG